MTYQDKPAQPELSRRGFLVASAATGALSLGYGVMLWLTWPLGNHGLWASFIGFLVLRAGLQLALMPRLLRREMA